MKKSTKKSGTKWVLLGVLAIAILLGLAANGLLGCATSQPHVAPQPLPPGSRVTVQYDHQQRVVVVSIAGVKASRMGVYYPGHLAILNSPPFEIRPEAEFIRFNLQFEQVTAQGVGQPFALLTEHSPYENPSLLGPGTSILCDRSGACDFLIDMGPLLNLPRN